MDYPNRSRVKIWGTAEFVEDDPDLLAKVADPDYKARPERVLVFHLKVWSPNCNQQITPRFTSEEMAPTVQELQQRIAELEEQNATLRKQLPEGLAGPHVKQASARNVEPIFAEMPTKGADCALS